MTSEEMLQGLRELGDRLGKEPTAKDVDADKTIPARGTYERRFGSFSRAKELAGFNNNTRQKYSDEKLKTLLVDFYNKNGRAPTQKECRAANGFPSINTFKERFGGWEEALNAAGVPKNILRSTQVDDEALLESLKRFYKENGTAPRHEDCNSGEYPYLKSHMIYVRRFGMFTDALVAAGVPLNESNSSGVERELLDFVRSVYDGKVLSGSWILGSLELDIYIPDKGLAIEFNGLYWHSKKDKYYHIDKTKLAESKGIRLIHVFEDEWYKSKLLVKSRIRSILGKSTTIAARECTVVELDNCSEFLKSNHIQGACGSSIKLGLYYYGELVAVQTFGKSRFTDKYEWELLRYCSLQGINVVGGASKLMAYFLKKQCPSSIISYCDIRWNTGQLYEQLGFKFSHTSDPNYWYVKGRKRESRLKYQKHKLPELLDIFDPVLTEQENMLNNGYSRIYDCGNKVFVWEPSKPVVKSS